MVGTSVADYWDRFVGAHINSPDHWEANQVVRQSQWQFITGDPFQNPIDWFMKRFGPCYSMASICCGGGVLEKYIGTRYGGRIDGYDVSPGSLEKARKLCADLPGVHFHVADVNIAVWGAGYLDAVFANGALHHVTNLDHCLSQLRRALKPSGFLYVSDYVGPSRFQWTDVQLRLARELFEMVPAEFRRNTTLDRCDPVALEALDPSEAVRSDHIMDHIGAHFRIVELKERGGTLLAPIFGAGCISPTMFDSPRGMAIMKQMCEMERTMIDDGILASDHVTVVASPRH
jgi:SAM-dependent methyltransferase